MSPCFAGSLRKQTIEQLQGLCRLTGAVEENTQIVQGIGMPWVLMEQLPISLTGGITKPRTLQ
jgi:hypothetical protein